MGKIEDNFFLAGGDELMDGVAKTSGFVAESDAAAEVDDGDMADFARGRNHGWSSQGMVEGAGSQVNGWGHGG